LIEQYPIRHALDIRSRIVIPCSDWTTTVLAERVIAFDAGVMACVAIIVLGLATLGSANARAINFHHLPGYAGWASYNHVRPGYAGPAYSSAPDDRHFSLRSRPGSVRVDLGIEGYGCIDHPDYGLYSPHFC
jgi:hypothetical protein